MTKLFFGLVFLAVAPVAFGSVGVRQKVQVLSVSKDEIRVRLGDTKDCILIREPSTEFFSAADYSAKAHTVSYPAKSLKRCLPGKAKG